MEMDLDREALDQATLDTATLDASRVFLRRIADRFAPVRAIVFGSRARGDHEAGSDADLAIVLGGPPGDRWAVAGEMARLAFDVLMETDVLIDPLPLWEVEIEAPELFPNPSLLRAILRDGRPI